MVKRLLFAGDRLPERLKTGLRQQRPDSLARAARNPVQNAAVHFAIGAFCSADFQY